MKEPLGRVGTSAQMSTRPWKWDGIINGEFRWKGEVKKWNWQGIAYWGWGNQQSVMLEEPRYENISKWSGLWKAPFAFGNIKVAVMFMWVVLMEWWRQKLVYKRVKEISCIDNFFLEVWVERMLTRGIWGHSKLLCNFLNLDGKYQNKWDWCHGDRKIDYVQENT